MIIEIPKPYKPKCVSFGFPENEWEEQAYFSLRKQIFCVEQKIFKGTDRDQIDDSAIHIAAFSECMGMLDDVIGIVRIDERKTGVWYGSRLGVAQNTRTLSRFDAHYLFNQDVNPLFTISVGAALIYKAVSTANKIGCTQFLAHVQHQNRKLFERLHWKVVDQMECFGIQHYVMEADLSYYPPSVHADKKHSSKITLTA